jgi:dTDP-4-dehydrorhamnose 3,5-epimerase
MKKRPAMEYKETKIPGLIIIEKKTYEDDRGFFREVVRVSEIEEKTGVKFKFKQWNHSLSNPKVLRGLHSEEQNKIVYPVTGKVFSAYADVRSKSKTFGKVVSVKFEEPNLKAVFVPKGVANSVCVYGGQAAHYFYLVDKYYSPEIERGIAWDDADLSIDWPVKNPIISKRDRNNPTLRQLYPEKFKNK